MKSQTIAQTVSLVMCVGLSLVARAAEPDKKLSEPTPAAPTEKPDSGDERAAWEGKEAELLTALKEVVATLAEARKGDTATDWTAVETNVKQYVFAQVTDKGERVWPESQFNWVRDAHRDLQRDERREKRDFSYERELEILAALEGHLYKEVQALNKGGEAESAAQDKPDGSGDELLWKFRDKGGSRTTKPRYKGQEPLN